MTSRPAAGPTTPRWRSVWRNLCWRAAASMSAICSSGFCAGIEQARIPAIYSFPAFTAAGGLMSLAPDENDLFRRAATYVDRILNGASPADIAVEEPTKFELVVNLTTAKALGLAIPQTFLLRADELID